MALTVIATVGASNANSYITKAEASSAGGYWETRLFATNWTGASAANKNASIVWATSILDDWIDWIGYRVDEQDNQSLRWPRYGVSDVDGYSIDSDIVPQFLKDATAELAGHLLGLDANPTAAPDTQGYSEMQVGSLRLKIDKADRDVYTLIPDSVVAMVEPYGNIRKRGGNMVADLVRA